MRDGRIAGIFVCPRSSLAITCGLWGPHRLRGSLPRPHPNECFLHISHACELPHPRTVRGRTTNKCSVSLNLRYFSTCLHFYDRALLGRSLCWLATQTKHTLHTRSKRQLTGNWTFHVTIFAARPARPGVPRARAALARAQEKYVFQKICVW